MDTNTINYFIQSLDIGDINSVSKSQFMALDFKNFLFTWNILFGYPFYWYHWSLYKDFWLANHINFSSTFTADWWNLTLKIFKGLKRDNIWPYFKVKQDSGDINIMYWWLLVNKLIIRADSIERKVLLLDSILNTDNIFMPLNNQFFKGLKSIIYQLSDSYLALLYCENSNILKQLKMYFLYADLYTIDMLIDKLILYHILKKDIEPEWFYFIKLYKYL